MQNNHSKNMFVNDIKNKKYIDNYIDKWLKLETTDKPYVGCDICGYVSNASIHQHLLIPEKFKIDSGENRILHLCANCNDEFRAILNRHQFEISAKTISQICEKALEELKDMKKKYRELYQNLERIEI